MTPEEYIEKVYLWLTQMFASGDIPEESFGTMMQSAVDRVMAEGVHPKLSFYADITSGIPYAKTEYYKAKHPPTGLREHYKKMGELQSARVQAQKGAPPTTPAWQRAPSPRYYPTWAGMGEEMDVPQTGRWQDWFSSKYSGILSQFQATIPRFERGKWMKTVSREEYGYTEGGMRRWTQDPEEAKEKGATEFGTTDYRVPMTVAEIEAAVGKRWTAYLKKKRPELREQWWSLSPYERGERPAAHAPRIRTVGF